MISCTRTIRLHDTDAAGVLYFGTLFPMAHEAYEAFMESIGFPIVDVLKEARFALPIVHTEADYAIPLRLGDKVEIEVTPDQLGQTSFSIHYRVLKGGKVAALLQTVHVCVNRRTGKKSKLPPKLATAIKRSM